jgi:hypothetical protein
MGVTRKLVTNPEKHAARSKDTADGKMMCSLRYARAEAFAEYATLLMIAKTGKETKEEEEPSPPTKEIQIE